MSEWRCWGNNSQLSQPASQPPSHALETIRLNLSSPRFSNRINIQWVRVDSYAKWRHIHTTIAYVHKLARRACLISMPHHGLYERVDDERTDVEPKHRITSNQAFNFIHITSNRNWLSTQWADKTAKTSARQAWDDSNTRHARVCKSNLCSVPLPLHASGMFRNYFYKKKNGKEQEDRERARKTAFKRDRLKSHVRRNLLLFYRVYSKR